MALGEGGGNVFAGRDLSGLGIMIISCLEILF